MTTLPQTSVNKAIEKLRNKANFLEHHADLLGQFDSDTQYAEGVSFEDMTWVDVDPNWGDEIVFRVHGVEVKKVMAILRKAFAPGKWDKEAGYHFSLIRDIGDLRISIEANRDKVCKKVVVGKKVVTTPAREETTTEVEEVEWVCGSLAG